MTTTTTEIIEAEVTEETSLAIRKPQEPAKPDNVVAMPVRDFIDNPYVGAGTIDLEPNQIAILEKYTVVPNDWIEIKPDDGLVYMGHMHYRRVANEAFGPGRWALVPAGDFKVEDSGNVVTLYRTYRFYVNGKFLREAVGPGQYFKSNRRMNYADAAESCESDVLKRLLKPFGIAGQCWDRRYVEWFKATYCKKVGNDWKRVKWDKAGWWDGTTELREEAEEPKPKVTVTSMKVLVENAGSIKKGQQDYYWIQIAGTKYWTESELVFLDAKDRIETGAPVAFTYNVKNIILIWDNTKEV